ECHAIIVVQLAIGAERRILPVAMCCRAPEEEGARGGFQGYGGGRVILVRMRDQDMTDGSGSAVEESLDVPVIRGTGIDDRASIIGGHEVGVGARAGHGAWVARRDAADA